MMVSKTDLNSSLDYPKKYQKDDCNMIEFGGVSVDDTPWEENAMNPLQTIDPSTYLNFNST